MAEWEVRKALAGQSAKKVEEIQKMMPDDFNRKLKEWEQIKSSSTSRPTLERKPRSSTSSSVQSGHPQKKKKSSREYKRRSYEARKAAAAAKAMATNDMTPMHERDTIWLEKELLKIQREKQRLERERAQFQEREQRLEKMRQALDKHHKKEVITVKTARGEEFCFGGISEKFTRKLYEWEEARGIAPEESTIALLQHQEEQQPKDKKVDGVKSKFCNAQLRLLIGFMFAELARSRSEGSLQELASATGNGSGNNNGGNKKGSGGNLSQNSSQSLNDLVDVTKETDGSSTGEIFFPFVL